MTVNADSLQKAFALAHRCGAQPDVPARERNYFRAIAWLIWKACGAEVHEGVVERLLRALRIQPRRCRPGRRVLQEGFMNPNEMSLEEQMIASRAIADYRKGKAAVAEKLTFDTNVPVTVALKYGTGKRVESRCSPPSTALRSGRSTVSGRTALAPM